MTQTQRPGRSKGGVSRRGEVMTYATGMTTDSLTDLIGFIVPLWALSLGMGPMELGILVSAKAFVPSFLAIHGGVLMDRYGTRLVLLLMAAGCTLIPPFFILSSWFPALLLLQMAIGTVTSFAWMGAQSLAVDIGRKNPAIVGRFSFFARIGVMLAPVTAGALWDLFPPWVAFVSVSVVGALFWLSVKLIPPTDLETSQGSAASSDQPFRWRDLMPRLSDYVGAIGLLALPVVAFVVIVSSVRIASATMLHSFYIIYLSEIGLQATVIGAFITLSQLAAAGGTLVAARLSRVIAIHWVFLGAVAVSIFGVFSTPLYGASLGILALAIAMRGLGQGISQPVMFIILSRAVGKDIQATAIGLRATGNRISSLTIPLVMGAIAEFWNLDATFLLTGMVLLAILGAAGTWLAMATRGKTAA